MTHSLKARALIIAVADYGHVSALPGIVREDATAIAALLTDPTAGGYASGAITICLDQQATLALIRAELDGFERTLAADETFLLYFSGHGHRATVDRGGLVCLNRLARFPSRASAGFMPLREAVG